MAPESLRVVTWNVAGWATTHSLLVHKFGSVRAFFDDFLRADIVCLQEMKVSEDKLTREFAMVEGFDSFWACSVRKKGYSGVTTYVRRRWTPSSAATRPFDDAELDDEGRCVITRHGALTVINVYTPHAGEPWSERPRLHYKMRFLERVREIGATPAIHPPARAPTSPHGRPRRIRQRAASSTRGANRSSPVI